MSEQRTHVSPGAIDELSEIFANVEVRRLLLVTGRESYERCGAAAKVAAMLGPNCHVERFSDFARNPTAGDVERGVHRARRLSPDLIVAIGGGSVLDMAKAIATLAPLSHTPRDVLLQGITPASPLAPVVAVPTTAGSGSEATRFAALYVDGVKHSLDHPNLLPAVALVDANLVRSSPPALLATTGLDALCQSIESLWAVRATPASQALARQAIEKVWPNLERAVVTGADDAIEALSCGAWYAGRAIDQSRTTAAHALSYPLTTHLGLPHGHAVALTLPFFFRINAEPGERDLQSGVPAQALAQTVTALCRLLGGGGVDACVERLEALPAALGLATRLTGVSDANLATMAREVNLARLANNPVVIQEEDVLAAWKRLC